MAAKPKIVIVGGGVGGVAVAKGLQGVADVTIVESKDYFEIPYPRVRLPVEPEFGDKFAFPMADIPGTGKLVKAVATSVTEQEVLLNDGSSLPFDYLVIATGSKWATPLWGPLTSSLEARKAEHVAYFRELSAAQNILIVGGGAVGLEIAGEIATDMPEKKVTLVHSGASLLDGYPPRLGRVVKNYLEELGVQMILNERAENVGGSWRLQKSGRSLTVDKVYLCVGGTPNTDFLRVHNADILNQKGYVKVDKFLQVEGHPNWFALGDITSLPDDRLGRVANDQGELLAANLKGVLTGKGKKLKVWKKNGGMEVLVLSVGRKKGAMTVFGCAWGGFPATSLKSKDLMTSIIRPKMGLPK